MGWIVRANSTRNNGNLVRIIDLSSKSAPNNYADQCVIRRDRHLRPIGTDAYAYKSTSWNRSSGHWLLITHWCRFSVIFIFCKYYVLNASYILHLSLAHALFQISINPKSNDWNIFFDYFMTYIIILSHVFFFSFLNLIDEKLIKFSSNHDIVLTVKTMSVSTINFPLYKPNVFILV